jgi:hypothetical protein
MRNQIVAILIAFLFCATLLVSTKPVASVEEQGRVVSLPIGSFFNELIRNKIY